MHILRVSILFYWRNFKLRLFVEKLAIVESLLFLQIGPFQTTKGEKAKLKVRVQLDKHGIVLVDSATVSTNGLRYICL